MTSRKTVLLIAALLAGSASMLFAQRKTIRNWFVSHHEPIPETRGLLQRVSSLISMRAQVLGEPPPASQEELRTYLQRVRTYDWGRLYEDAWQTPITASAVSTNNKDFIFTLRSAGPDGQFGTKDDIVHIEIISASEHPAQPGS